MSLSLIHVCVCMFPHHFFFATASQELVGEGLKREGGASPGGPVAKNPPADAVDMGSIPGREESSCYGAIKPSNHNY